MQIPITTELVNKILVGDQEAAREYRSAFWWVFALDTALAERMLSETNLDCLREARDLGIPPAHIMAMCHMHTPRSWSEGKTPTTSEAKRIVKKIRSMRGFLKELLPQLVFPMSEAPTDYTQASRLPILPRTAPSVWVEGCFPIIDRASMENLWKLVGRQNPKGPSQNSLAKIFDMDKIGLLDELADRIEAIIPTLQQIKPARRKRPTNSIEDSWKSINYRELMFTNSWDKLARERTHGPRDRLGIWFYYVTFGVHIEQDAFRKLREKAYRLWGY
ncbi:MAG TPA: hypothetical protein VN666_14240 [Nitrospira sp.]|nr:hypothetical protein [Nitrospira sp.]